MANGFPETGKVRLAAASIIVAALVALLAASAAEPGGVRVVPLFPAANDASREAILRVVNKSNRAGEVRVTAVDEEGWERAWLTVAVEARGVIGLRTSDLVRESATDPRGGADGGDWHLRLESDLQIGALAWWLRAADGTFTVVRDVSATAAADSGALAAAVRSSATLDPLAVAIAVNAGAQFGPGARDVHTADLDGDDDVDVLSASYADGTVDWHENVGIGLSATRPIADGAGGVAAVHAVDLDGDGDADVLYAAYLDDALYWQENLGGGEFAERQVVTVAADGAWDLHSADLDGDGDADVLSASLLDDTVGWHENLGGGAFAVRRTISTETLGAASVHAVDLDGDGDADVLSASLFDDTVGWHENLGGGAFAVRRTISTETLGAVSVYAVDLDGDGDADVLSASLLDDTVGWHENLGGGSFAARRAISTDMLGAVSVHAADLDGDGDMDVLAAAALDDAMVWHENVGGAKFAEPRVLWAGPLGAASMYAADLNGDGIAEALSSPTSIGGIVWHDPPGPGTVSRETIVSDPASAFGSDRELAVSRPPLLVMPADAVGQSLVRATGTVIASSAFSNPRVLADDNLGGRSVYPADLDGDGDIDVLVASSEDSTVGWYENQGNRSFSTRHVIETNAEGAWSTYAADLDGDGDLDVLAASILDDTVAWYENQDEGAFSTRNVLAADADGAISVHAADLDGDGDLDVLSASALDDTVGWYENRGEGAFSTRNAIAADADGAISVHTADLDGDGDLDVLLASVFDDTVGWYENRGEGAFSTRNAIAADADGAISVHAADLDGDGDPDVLAASQDDDTVGWYENRGEGAFSTRNALATDADGAASVFAADLDGDGDLDVLSASYEDDTVGWYENQGGGAFSARVALATDADGAASVHAADLDGDGDLDVLAATNYTFAWYENVDAPTAAPRGVRIVTRPGQITVSWDPLSGRTESGGAPETLRYVVSATPIAGDGTNAVSCTAEAPATECMIGVQPETPYTVSLFAENDDGMGPEWKANTTVEAPWGFSDARDLGSPVRGASAAHAADLDGDGNIDVVFASYLDDMIGWFYNLGDGRFFGILPIATGVDGAESIDTADLDNDGDLDVLSASSNDNTIAWHENLGRLSFQSHTISTDAILARDVHAADLNGDGYTDVLLASEHDNRIAWHVNLGDGTFWEARDIDTDANGAQAVHAADVDGDGDLDVLAASAQDDTVAWYENQGDLTFSERRVIDPNAGGAVSVYAADLDGDGAVDVLSASSWDDRIAWYSNPMGDGAFDRSTIDFSADGAWDVHAADLDGDGDSDVLSASRGADRIAWYENTVADGRPPNFSGRQTIATDAEGAESVHVADLDGDGDLDVLSASFHDNTIAWYENAGSPSAPAAAPGGVGTVAGPGRIEVEWQPLSGRAERGAATELRYVATATPSDGGAIASCTVVEPASACTIHVRSLLPHSVTVRAETAGGAGPSSGDGAATLPTVTPEWGFSGALALALDEGARGALSTHAADLDGDGDLDVLVGSFYNWIAWYENLGNDTFAARRTIADDFNGRVWSVHTGDLDGDGDLDVLAPLETDNTIAWYENDGSGAFTAMPAIADDATGVRGAHAADLDGDGDLDVLAASYGNDTIAWYENDGEGVFTAMPAIATDADGAHAVRAADLDGDGDLDVLASSNLDETVGWYQNDGSGGFSSRRTIETDSGEAFAVHAADLDGDGDLDVLAASYGNKRVAWYENDGDGAFPVRRAIAIDIGGPFDVHVADLDGDGDLDVLSAIIDDDLIAWFENQGGGNFSTQAEIWSGADQVSSVFAADLDGDGDLDVLSAIFGDATVAWYENLATPSTPPAAPITAPGNVSVRTGGSYISVSWDALGAWANGGSALLRYVATATPDDGEPSANCVTEPPSTACAIEDLRTGATYAVVVHTENALGEGPASIPVAVTTAEAFSAQSVISTDADSPLSVQAVDLDGDGDPDVLSTSNTDDTIAWYENTGNGSFAAQRVITADAGGPHSAHAVDLDGDGDADVLFTSFFDDEIAWFENTGNGSFAEERVISTAADGPDSVHAADFDGDGDADVVSASREDDTIAWYENLGDGTFSEQVVISTAADFASSVRAVDLDGDGEGDWRLLLESQLELHVQIHVRTPDGFTTSVHDGATRIGQRHYAPWFNPAGDTQSQGRLRLVNASDEAAGISIVGWDDEGAPAPGGAVGLTLPAGESRSLDAAALEEGAEGLDGSLGSGSGSWWFALRSDVDIRAMNLVESADGYLSGVSMSRSLAYFPDACFDPASDAGGDGVSDRCVEGLPSDLLALRGCTDGRYVDDPGNSPGLVGDCRALVGIANAWARDGGLPEDHAMRRWGGADRARLDAWEGIEVAGGRVVAVDLAGSRREPGELGGALPPELGRLTELMSLDLSYNRLTGPIPAELNQLARLTRLDLSFNRFSGAIPAELGNLPDLRELNVSNNRLTGTVPWAYRDRLMEDGLVLLYGGNAIAGLAPPPLRGMAPVFPDDPLDNGNASHRSVAFYQGPLVWEKARNEEAVEHQQPVLGRWAVIVVNIEHGTAAPPPLRARVIDGSGAIVAARLAKSAPPRTASAAPGRWRTEYAFHLPGALNRAGRHFVSVIDPGDEIAETDETDNEAEPMALYGQQAPRLRITFIPVTFPGRDPLSLDANALVRGIRAYWPVADDIDAIVAPALESDASNQYELLQEVLAMWNAEADPDEFYFGIFAQPWTGGRGVAYRPGRVAVSEFSEFNTIPHEFGHNLNLRHPPGCEARHTDRRYPYPDGRLGPLPVWDAVWHRAVSGDDPAYADVMSYCGSHRLISDYHYRKAWQNRLADAAEQPAAVRPAIHWSARSWNGPAAPAQSEEWGTERPVSLALSGRIDEQGRWTLTHARASSRGPRAPGPGDTYFLVLMDGAGLELHREALSVEALSHGGGGGWAARVPLPPRAPSEVAIVDARGVALLRAALPAVE